MYAMHQIYIVQTNWLIFDAKSPAISNEKCQFKVRQCSMNVFHRNVPEYFGLIQGMLATVTHIHAQYTRAWNEKKNTCTQLCYYGANSALLLFLRILLSNEGSELLNLSRCSQTLYCIFWSNSIATTKNISLLICFTRHSGIISNYRLIRIMSSTREIRANLVSNKWISAKSVGCELLMSEGVSADLWMGDFFFLYLGGDYIWHMIAFSRLFIEQKKWINWHWRAIEFVL